MSTATWEPGHPLYEHPWVAGDPDGQAVRYLAEVLLDEADVFWRYHAVNCMWTCQECEVAWSGALGAVWCWICGRLGAEPRLW